MSDSIYTLTDDVFLTGETLEEALRSALGEEPALVLDAPRPELESVRQPKHYTSHPSGIECIEITQFMGFCLGNVIKYVWRADLKGGVEDLRKAQQYLQYEIDRRLGRGE